MYILLYISFISESSFLVFFDRVLLFVDINHFRRGEYFIKCLREHFIVARLWFLTRQDPLKRHRFFVFLLSHLVFDSGFKELFNTIVQTVYETHINSCTVWILHNHTISIKSFGCFLIDRFMIL